MKTIHKFPLKIQDTIELELPKGAKILDVQTQDGNAMLWALVDTTRPKETRRFRLFGTGQPIVGPVGTFVKTFLLSKDNLVFHLFELT